MENLNALFTIDPNEGAFKTTPSGGLTGTWDYVYWEPGEDIELDGRFTVDELKAMIAHIEKINSSPAQRPSE